MTSIEWLIDALENPKLKWDDIKEQAKERHKQEIINAFSAGAGDGFDGLSDSNKEQYYNEKFKQK